MLTPAASRWCSQRYRELRQRGGSRLGAATLTLGWLLAWTLFPLERPGWQWVLGNARGLYPHLTRPRAGDPVRILLQSLWMLVRRPKPVPLRWPASWQRLWQWGTQALGAFLIQQEERVLAAARVSAVIQPIMACLPVSEPDDAMCGRSDQVGNSASDLDSENTEYKESNT